MYIINLQSSKKYHYRITKPGNSIIFLYSNFKTSINASVNIDICVKHSKVLLYGMFYGTGKGTLSLHAVVRHVVGYSASEIQFRSVVNDTSYILLKSLIAIDKKISQVTAGQTSRSLLLSPHAHVVAKPDLEIASSGGICSHSSSISEPERDSILYLTSRGISEKKAYELYSRGFLLEMTDGVCDEKIKKEIISNFSVIQ